MRFSHLAFLGAFTSVLCTPHPAAGAVKGLLKGKAFKVLPLGDSITYGVGSSTGNGYRQSLLTSLTNAGAAADFIGSVQSGSMADNYNDGYPGYRIDQIYTAVQQTYLAGLVPDVILLHAGTNDALQNYNTSTMADRLGQLIDALNAGWPNANVIVAKPIGTTVQCAEGVLVIYDLQIDGIVQSRIANGKRVTVTDMSSVVNLLTDLNTDGIHPIDAGYTKMANKWFTSISALATSGAL